MRLEELPPKLQEQARAKLNLQEKKNKYNAEKTMLDNIEFDSKGEASRYAQLRLLERAGAIQDLRTHPRFLLQDSFTYQGHKERKIEYEADFEYTLNGKKIVEDYKSPITRTQLYKLKRKLFLYKYGDRVEFREVYNETNKP